MSVDVSLDVEDIVGAIGVVREKMAEHIPAALAMGADLVAAEAKRTHEYQDQTSLLTNSIMSDGVHGALFGGSLEAVVSAGAPYAPSIEFGAKAHVIKAKHRKALRWPIEGGFMFAGKVNHPGNREYAFLGNALDVEFPGIVENVEDAVEASFAEAGLE